MRGDLFYFICVIAHIEMVNFYDYSAEKDYITHFNIECLGFSGISSVLVVKSLLGTCHVSNE